MASKHLEKINQLASKNNLLIFDRGYWLADLAAEIDDSGNKFLFRVQSNTSALAYKSKENSGFIKVKANKHDYTYRFYKFFIESGELEILITNLDSELFPDLKNDFIKAVISDNPIKFMLLMNRIKKQISMDTIPIRKGRHVTRNMNKDKPHNCSKMLL